VADSNIPITGGSGYPVDTRTQADGDHRQVVVQGDATAAYTQTVRTAGDAVVGFAVPAITGTITAADSVVTSVSLIMGPPTGNVSNAVYTGTPTANSSVVLALEGCPTLTFSLTGTFGASMAVEKSFDGGVTYYQTIAYAVPGSTLPKASTAVASTGLGKGVYVADSFGATHVRVRATSYSSGTVTVKMQGATTPGIVYSFAVNPAPLNLTSTSNVSNVAGTTTSTSFLAFAANRSWFSIYNDSTAALYVALGAAASTSQFSVKLGPGGYYENSTFNGNVFGMWDTATGNARVTALG
jgi:hypothetical protein